MEDREAFIKTEHARRRKYEADKSSFLAELDKPDIRQALAMKTALARLADLQEDLQELNRADSAARMNFRNDLEKAVSPELTMLIKRAEADCNIARRVGPADVADVERAIQLRSWLDGVSAALKDETTSARDIAGWQARGQALVSPDVWLVTAR